MADLASPTGLYAATVTRVDALGPYVMAPRIIAGHEFGPCQSIAPTIPYEAGDRVLVGFLEDRVDELVIVGAAGPAPKVDLATQDELQVETNWRTLWDADHEARIANLEVTDGILDCFSTSTGSYNNTVGGLITGSGFGAYKSRVNSRLAVDIRGSGYMSVAGTGMVYGLEVYPGSALGTPGTRYNVGTYFFNTAADHRTFSGVKRILAGAPAGLWTFAIYVLSGGNPFQVDPNDWWSAVVREVP